MVTVVAEDALLRGEVLARPVLYRVKDATRVLSMSPTVVYDLIRAGRLRTVKEGRARLIPASAIAEYVDLLEREAGGDVEHAA